MTILCFEAHHADGRVWAVRHRGRWMRATRVSVQAPNVTVYRGRKAPQPKAYLAFREPVKVRRARGGIQVVPA